MHFTHTGTVRYYGDAGCSGESCDELKCATLVYTLFRIEPLKFDVLNPKSILLLWGYLKMQTTLAQLPSHTLQTGAASTR